MKTTKQKIIEIIGNTMEPERAELKADEIIRLFNATYPEDEDEISEHSIESYFG